MKLAGELFGDQGNLAASKGVGKMKNTNDGHATPPAKRRLRWKIWSSLLFALFVILSFYLDFHLAILGYLVGGEPDVGAPR